MTPDDIVIRSQTDLEAAWRALLRPLGFTSHSTWIMLVGPDGRPLPQLVEVEGTAEPPDEGMVASLGDFLGELVSSLVPGASVAFLRSRPGAGGVTADDRAWARALLASARHAGLPTEVVHRACDVDVLLVPPDETMAAAG